MFRNFWRQVKLADQLGFGTAWVAETHLSCQVQKKNPQAVIPHFQGEIGLNTDILQMAHLVFSHTRKIHVGSAIRNIICNGGPVAHAEAVRTFLALQEMVSQGQHESGQGLPASESRRLEIGFAAGRFPFSNEAYGFLPKTDWERAGWDVIKNHYFRQATEIFLRLLKGQEISSADVSGGSLSAKDFRDPNQWAKVWGLAPTSLRDSDSLRLPLHWQFPILALVPREVSLKNLRLTIGSHDPEAQILANQFLPVGVFNLSITPPEVLEATHSRMQRSYHPSGGVWQRAFLPRTVMLFLDSTNSGRAKEMAARAWKSYWTAMEGTLDPQKVQQAVHNTIAGTPEEVRDLIASKYHPEDRLMLWFDFNNHDTEAVEASMRLYMEKVAPFLPLGAAEQEKQR